MTQSNSRVIQALAACVLFLGIVGCANNILPGQDDNMHDNGNGDPTGKLAVFEDPDSEFSTTDVYDVDDQIVQFNTENDSIIWAADGMEYRVGQFAVNGNFPNAAQSFLVRFGTKGGERRAYFTETGPATICDIRVAGGLLNIFPTNETVPQE